MKNEAEGICSSAPHSQGPLSALKKHKERKQEAPSCTHTHSKNKIHSHVRMLRVLHGESREHRAWYPYHPIALEHPLSSVPLTRNESVNSDPAEMCRVPMRVPSTAKHQQYTDKLTVCNAIPRGRPFQSSL